MARWLVVGLVLLGAAACAGEQTVEEAESAESAVATPEAQAPEPAQVEASPKPTSEEWAAAVEGLERRAGFLDIYIDQKGGRVLAAFPAPDAEGVSLRAIYAGGLTAGLGSNPIGLDRGLFDGGSLVAFRRVGGKLIAEQENWTYRASADNPLEKKAVRESFARSFLWSGDIEAEADGALLVDFSSFLTRDTLGVVAALKRHPEGGDFSIADDRSMPDLDATLVFPDNVEFDAYLTLVSSDPGDEVWATAPDARSITLVQHHSLVRLPDDGYRPRIYDPRSGTIDVPFYDYSAALAGEVRQAFARRYRLEKEDPAAVKGPVKEPLVFYVDSGAPEQIGDALIEGAAWWAEAFEAAGFENAYRVQRLPEGAHPRDIRYNVIQWTHRQTRGWSYGGGVSDPRTGEMIKASVILGSQRVRQDRMIFEGLAGAGKSGSGEADDPVEIALARIRQLSAHEVGHTLGFAHNFAASSNDKASVMDYPAPDVRVGEGGSLDFTNAYGVGVGAWDILSARWLYTQFPEGADEAAELDRILREGYRDGLRYVADSEGRSVGTAHPYGSVWDNGGDAVAALEEAMRVRRIALDNFSADTIADGRPYAALRQVIVPIYLYHRYQVAAAAKLIGGFEFNYGVKGDGSAPGAPVANDVQRRALASIVATLDPATLDLPTPLLNRLTPSPGGFGGLPGGAEEFASKTGPLFDLLSAADASAKISMGALMHRDRAARLVEYERRSPNAFGFDDVLTAIETRVFTAQDEAQRRAIARRLQTRFVSQLIALSMDEAATPAVRSLADAKLRAVANRLSPSIFGANAEARDHNAWLSARIEAHLARPATSVSPKVSPPDIPPGSPIGSGFMETCWHCEDLPPGE